jgi:hypothetical protein
MSTVRKVLFLTAILILLTMTASTSPLNDSPLLGFPTRYAIAHQAAPDRDLPVASRDLPAASSARTATDNGLPLGINFLIEDQSSDLSNPSAAYDSSRNEYWVVYEANYNQTIRAARLSAQGRVLSYTDIAYHPSQVLKNPDLAYNSATGAFLVVWDYYDGSRNHIYGRILDPDSILGPETNLGTGAALRDRYKPAVAYASTSDKFLVVWESVVWQSGGTYDVEAQIVTSYGTLENLNFFVAIGNWQFIHYEPDLAYNRSRNEYLVAWVQEEKAISQTDIFARRVTASGVVLDTTAITIGYHTAPETGPVVAAIPTVPNYGMYAVAWELHYTDTDSDIYARGVTGLGATNPVVLVTASGDNEQYPAIVGNEARDQFLVSWTGPYPDPYINTGIWTRPLLLNGALTSQPSLVAGLFADHSALAAGAAGVNLLTYQDPNLFIPVTLDIWGYLWIYRSYMPMVIK